MGKGSNTTTTQQNQTYTPAGYGYIQNALNQGQAAAQLPFNIPQAPVAGFSGQQQQAFNEVGNAQNQAQPYFQQASNLFNQSAQAPNVSQFFNPLAGAVTSQLQNIFGQQNSQNTGQLTQAAGGVGADRIAVGQSELANQQGLAAGQTLAGLYQPALQAAQQQQSLQQGAAYGQESVGQGAQNAALSGAQALLGTGGLQQQLSQAQLNAPYQLALAQAAFPYQQAQFNAGITGSLAPALGGTTQGYGQTTAPAPSLLSQILGGGTAAAGILGGTGAFGSNGYLTNAFGSNAAYGGGNYFSGDAYGGSASNPLPGLVGGTGPNSDYGARGGAFGKYAGGGAANPYADGGGGGVVYSLPSGQSDTPINVQQQSLIPQGNLPQAQVHMPSLNLNPPSPQSNSNSGASISQGIGDAVKLASLFAKRGGAINPYADGGDTTVIDPDEPFRMPDQGAVDAWRSGVDANMAAGQTATPMQPMSYTGPDSTAAFPPPPGAHGRSVATPNDGSAAGAATDSVSPASSPVSAGDPYAAPTGGSDDGQSFIKSPWAALTAAGLGMMAGTSPFAAVNIGQGGLQGLKALETQRTEAQKDETIKQAADRLKQEAQFHQDQYTKMQPYQQGELAQHQAELKQKQEYQNFEMNKPVPMGQTTGPLGLPVTTYGVRDENGKWTPVQGNAAQDGGADSPIKNIAQAIENGHRPPNLTNLGRIAPMVAAQLEKDGFNQTQALLEYDAAHKQILSLNGPQMVRFVGLARSVDNTIDEANELAAQMKNSGIPMLNSLKLQAYINAEGNSANGKLAARYVGAVNTLKEEFANLANGGYAPTEPAWKLANEQINGNYGVDELGASLGEVQRLIRYRLQGIPNIQTLGPGAPNRFVPGINGGPGAGGTAPPAAAPGSATPAAAPAAPPATGAPSAPSLTPEQRNAAIGAARTAIANGKDRASVIKRLQDNGIDPSGL